MKFLPCKNGNLNSNPFILVKIPASVWKIMGNHGKHYSNHYITRSKQSRSRLENVQNPFHPVMLCLLYQNQSSAKRWRFACYCAISIAPLDDTWYIVFQDVSIDFSVEQQKNVSKVLQQSWHQLSVYTIFSKCL